MKFTPTQEKMLEARRTMSHGPTRRGFIGTSLATLAALAIPLPLEFLDNGTEPTQAKLMHDGWVGLLQPCTIAPTDVRRGIDVTRAMIEEMARNFSKPLPLSIDFQDFPGGMPVGFVSEVRSSYGWLEARLELPSFNRKLLKEYRAIVPAFLSHSVSDSGAAMGCKLVATALTNTPAVPDAHKLHV